MTGKRLDITNKRFGALVAQKPVCGGAIRDGETIWQCVCDCGNTCLSPVSSLRCGRKTSCGCGLGTKRKKRSFEHLNKRLSSPKTKRCTSGVKNIYKVGEYWQVRFIFRNKCYLVGSFKDFDVAVCAKEQFLSEVKDAKTIRDLENIISGIKRKYNIKKYADRTTGYK